MKYKLGDLIEQVNIKCGFLNYPNISGINILKQFMPSKNVGTDTSKYLRVPFGHFACNLMHVGRDEKIPMALNLSKEDVVVSNAYFIFKVIDEIHLMKEYLNILFTSPEFDRYAWFATDASVRGNLDWDRFCEIEIDLPPLEIQEKYVTVYNGLLANQKAYENGLEDLKLVCDSTIEKLKQEMIPTKLVNLIEITDNKNTNLEYNLESVRGISNGKEFIPTKAKMDGVSLSPYLIISSNEFAFVSVTSRNGEKISIAHNDNSENYLCSSSYISWMGYTKLDRKNKLI